MTCPKGLVLYHGRPYCPTGMRLHWIPMPVIAVALRLPAFANIESGMWRMRMCAPFCALISSAVRHCGRQLTGCTGKRLHSVERSLGSLSRLLGCSGSWTCCAFCVSRTCAHQLHRSSSPCSSWSCDGILLLLLSCWPGLIHRMVPCPVGINHFQSG